MRQSLFGFIAITLALGLFAVMDVLISNDLDYEKPNKSRAYLNFIRLDPADTVTNTKDRRIPEPPPPQDMPETPDFSAAVDPINSSLSMTMPSIGMPINSGDGPYLGALQKGSGLSGFDTDVIPVVRVQAAYPRRAKQAGIEGSVTMEVLIKPDGTVSQAKVLESTPPRMFDQAALVAIQRWKFRPKIVDGTPVSQRARQTIQFSLEN